MRIKSLLEFYLKEILRAKVYDISIETPCEYAKLLSKRFNNKIYLKREDLQQVFSFKLRGAYNKIAKLSIEQLQSGVITASAGNHAQGVALSAKKLGIKATIVMPETTPLIKVNAVKQYQANIVLVGDTYNEALKHALELSKKQNLSFIHPYDDPYVIAGQGTIAMEILKQQNDLDIIFVPVGGGGLIAGIAAYIKNIRPEIKVIAVEPEDAACLNLALKNSKRSILKKVGIFADGVAVKQIGKHPFAIAKHCVDEVVTVSIDEICASIKDIFEDTRIIAEPAGALSLAGAKKYIQKYNIQQKNLNCIVSGANINFDRLRHITERTDIGEQSEILLAVTIPEKKGSFKTFCKVIGNNSITEFNYRYNNKNLAQVFVGISTKANLEDSTNIINKLKAKNYQAVDMSDNEMAKLHIRHMVGGVAFPKDEILYRFQFPERPGALLEFLQSINRQWNISLFHYRNHGAAYGRVLIGLQIPKQELNLAELYFQQQNYTYQKETDNPAYQLFLK